MIRRIRFALLASLAVSSMASHASLIEKVRIDCSDILNITGTTALDLSCTGALSISGEAASLGLIQADQGLSIWAAGGLSLRDVRLSASNISLTSDTSVVIDPSTQLDTGGGALVVTTLEGEYRRGSSAVLSDYHSETGQFSSALELAIENARQQTLPLSVPEPGRGWLMLMALPGIALASRARRGA